MPSVAEPLTTRECQLRAAGCLAALRSFLAHHSGIQRPACPSPLWAAGCTPAGPGLGAQSLCGGNLISSGWNDEGAWDINGPGREAGASEVGKPQALFEAATEPSLAGWAPKIHIWEAARAAQPHIPGNKGSRSLKGRGLGWCRLRGRGQQGSAGVTWA